MKLNFDLNDDNMKDKLKDNQEFLIVISVFAISILLFLVFIVPSIISFPSKVSERGTEVEKLNQIKNSKRILETASKEQLDGDLDLATRALPSDRNFELILGAISDAATRSNSIVTGYKYVATINSAQVDQGGFPGLTFKITMVGDLEQAADFADELSTAFPISEVKEISYEQDLLTITVDFYYKPFTEVNAEDVALTRERTPGETKALKEISGWNYFTLDQGILQNLTSTESAEVNSPF